MYNVSVEIDFEDDFIPAKHFFKEYPVRLTEISDKNLKVTQPAGTVHTFNRLNKINLPPDKNVPVKLKEVKMMKCVNLHLSTNRFA